MKIYKQIKVITSSSVPRLVAIVLVATLTITQLIPAKPLFADTGGYAWPDATYVDANYDWGYSACPSNDTGCMSLSGYLNGVKYGEADPWVYYLRNCTSYVAWKINQVFHKNISGWGNASSWGSSAINAGYTYDSTPQVGDIAQWVSANHVAYVYAVNNGVASLDEYNAGENNQWGNFSSDRTTTTGSAGTPDHYIHIGTVGPTGPAGLPINITQGSGVGNAGDLGNSISSTSTTSVSMSNQYLISPDGRYAAIFQPDGNLVVYGPTYTYTWYSGTQNEGAVRATLQTDGNFVIYNSSGSPLWQSYTGGVGPSTLTMQNDGDLVLAGPQSQVTWATHYSNSTGAGQYMNTDRLVTNNTLWNGQYIQSADGRFVFIFQTDGNFVLYGPGYHALWQTGTSAEAATHVTLQGDGNLVVYTANNAQALWASGTGGDGPSTLIDQTDGNMVLYGPSSATWASEAAGPSYTAP